MESPGNMHYFTFLLFFTSYRDVSNIIRRVVSDEDGNMLR